MGLDYYTHAAQIFSDVVARHGARPAILWSPGSATSYDDLDRLSNQVAAFLLSRGVHAADTVCISLEKSVAAYATMLACLKIGVPYFVIDPANPAQRTRHMVDRCAPALAFVEAGRDHAGFLCPTIAVDAGDDAVRFAEGLSDAAPAYPWTVGGSTPAYIMFTSGSTGSPKGVTISQANLVNFIRWSQTRFSTRHEDVFTNVNPLYFDNSVFDIYSSLFSGASLVPFTAATLADPRAVVARIEQLGCTLYFSVPSLLVYLQTMKLVTPASFPTLRTIVFGGEGYPRPMLKRLFDAVGGRISLVNVYGPTECTCICSAYGISGTDLVEPTGYAPLGHLIPNFSHVIVDEGRAVAPGETGELWLGGPCVGLGYYADPELTSAAFVQNPTHDRYLDRMYRTGDLVRCDPADGKIHFVGRADAQIKHQGYRIELGEIEHALAGVDGVAEAAAVYVRTATSGRIVGVVASARPLDAAIVKRALAAALPKYMVPERIVVVAALLKNANGKIDRRAIAASLAPAEVQ